MSVHSKLTNERRFRMFLKDFVVIFTYAMKRWLAPIRNYSLNQYDDLASHKSNHGIPLGE